jgi:hypothetical protein
MVSGAIPPMAKWSATHIFEHEHEHEPGLSGPEDFVVDGPVPHFGDRT